MVIAKKKNNTRENNNQGFSILEASIALTTLAICLACAMPLFLYSKMNNSKSEIRTGALMVAQRVLDDVRGTPFQRIPLSSPIGGDPPPSSIATCDEVVNQGVLCAMGRKYQTRKFHCEASADPCTDNYKTVRVQVNYNDSTVYEMSAGFTNFK